MPSTLTSNGLTIESKAQIIADLVALYQGIYGPDINVNSNSPDGQLINIQAQLVSDFNELLQGVYNSFAIHSAFGTRLDQLVALNGLQRKQGSRTLAQVVVTVTKALTIFGLDQSVQPVFTVADSSGNQFQLVATHFFPGALSSTLTFQAVTIGQIQTTANTITNIVTSTLGVGPVNNPSTAVDVVGTNEESDAQLRVRHDRAFNLATTGPADAVEAALRNIASVQDAYVVENNTGGVVNTIPANSIWCIVRGGTAPEIAQAIYAKKLPGCGMKGSVQQIVSRPNGAQFTAAWDTAQPQALTIKFSIIWRGAAALANADVITKLAAALVYTLGQSPSVGDIVQAMQVIAPTAIVTINSNTQGVSPDGINWTNIVAPSDAQHYFTVSSANITIT